MKFFTLTFLTLTAAAQAADKLRGGSEEHDLHRALKVNGVTSQLKHTFRRHLEAEATLLKDPLPELKASVAGLEDEAEEATLDKASAADLMAKIKLGN